MVPMDWSIKKMQVTISEAARRLGVAEKTVRRRVHSGELMGTQVSTRQGFTWMVEIPDDVSDSDGHDRIESGAMADLVEVLKEEVSYLLNKTG
jgi:excisionase family DNA binding protein